MLSATKRTIRTNDKRERLIWASVILQAIADRQAGCDRAKFWLNEPDGQFAGLAEALNLNAQAIRERAASKDLKLPRSFDPVKTKRPVDEDEYEVAA